MKARSSLRLFLRPISSACTIALLVGAAGRSHAADEPSPKTDAELHRAVIGTWEDHPTYRTEMTDDFTQYRADGTFHSIGLLRMNHETRSAIADGKWMVKDGVLVSTVTKSSFEMAVGIVSRDRIVAATPNLLVTSSTDGIDRARPAHFPQRLPPLYRLRFLTAEQCRILGLAMPEYPNEARRKGLQGSGYFRADIAKNGDVSDVEVLRSTGSKILDDATRDTLLHWRFKQANMDGVVIAIAFGPNDSPSASGFSREPALSARPATVSPGGR